jgi:hypothetical protein
MPMEIQIGVRRGQRYTLLVDEADYERVSAYKWWPFKREHLVYARTLIDGKNILLHRFLMGPKKGEVVDHIDGNPLNNQRSNLRVCTQGENVWFARERGAFGVPHYTLTQRTKLADGSIRVRTYKRGPRVVTPAILARIAQSKS